MDETMVVQGAGGAGMVLIVELVLAILMIVCLWKIFTKAGQPGWAALIPFYNAYVMLQIAGKPGWWLILMFVPVVGLVVGILATVALAARFGKSVAFVVGMILLPIVFWPMLAFGSAQYDAAPAQA